MLAVQLTPSNGAAAAALGQTPVPPPAGQQAPPGAIPSTEAAALGESASLAAAVGAGWSQLANGRQDTSPAAASATPGGPAAPTAAAAAGGGNMAVTVFEVYQADPDEFISSMHATTDGQYIVLKSKIEVRPGQQQCSCVGSGPRRTCHAIAATLLLGRLPMAVFKCVCKI